MEDFLSLYERQSPPLVQFVLAGFNTNEWIYGSVGRSGHNQDRITVQLLFSKASFEVDS